MSLKNLTLHFPEETVSFAGGSFNVSGLSLSDIVVIVSMHRARLSEVFKEYAVPGAGAFELDENTALPFIMAFAQMAPGIAAHIIAQAEVREAGEDPQIGIAARLPVDVQAEALEKILKLTFQTEGGPKKVLDTLIRAFAGTMKVTAGLKT